MDNIDHIAVEVDDIKKALSWYLSNTSCKVLHEFKDWALIEYKNIKLAFVIPGTHPPHIAFVKNKPEKYGALTKHRDGSKSVYVKDPYNNFVEMIKY